VGKELLSGILKLDGNVCLVGVLGVGLEWNGDGCFGVHDRSSTDWIALMQGLEGWMGQQN
jgi:hypothetical protein